MHEGTWTIERCDYAEVRALAEALEIGEVTASVLLRRGYRDVEEARAFFVGERAPHDPFLLGDMAARGRADPRGDRRGQADLRPRRLRRRRDLRDRARRADAAQRSAPRSTGTCRAASTRATASRGRRSTGSPTTAAASCSPSTAGSRPSRRSREAKARGLEVIVTDHHRPGRDAAGLPDRRDAAVRLPVPGALRHGRRLQARAGARRGRLAAPRPRRARDDRRRRPAARREPLARDRRAARARAHAEARAAGADARTRASTRPPWTQRPSASGSRRGSTRPAGSAVRDAALELLLTDRRRRRRAGSPTSSRRSTATARRSRAGSSARPSPRSSRGPSARRRRRGYVIWGEDWHEGVIGIVASRLVERFNRPVVLIAGDARATGRARAARCRAFDLHGALAACSAHLRRFGGHRAAAGLSIEPREPRGVRARRSRRTPTRMLADDDLAPVTRDRRDRPAAPRSRSTSRRSSSGSRRSGSATRR